MSPPGATRRIIAGMATQPTRATTAPQAISALAAQVDLLVLFLDRFESVPDYACAPNVEVVRSQDVGDLRAGGKLLALDRCDRGDIYLFGDDDVAYPGDFAAVVARALDGDHQNEMVGFHGTRLRPPVVSYKRDRMVTQLKSALDAPQIVDVIATCAGGFRPDRLPVNMRRWPHLNMVDLQLALTAQAHGTRRVLLAREANWISFLAEGQPDSIYLKLSTDDSLHTTLANELLSMTPA